MKSRSEVLQAKKSSNAQAIKPSAEERTVPLPVVPPGARVKCEACGDESKAEDCSVRPDGFAECPTCAAPVKIEVPPKKEPSAGVAKVLEEKKAKEEKAAAKESAKPKPAPKFCGECGVELAWLTVGLPSFWYGCGHTKELHGMVDDPRQAKHLGTAPAPHGTRVSVEVARRNADDGKAAMAPSSASTGPTLQAIPIPGGTRLSLHWGDARMPIDAYNNFKCGGHILSLDVPEGEDVVTQGLKMIGDLEKIADVMFDRQHAWYKKKLGILMADD